MPKTKLLSTIFIGLVVFSSCKKLNETDVPLDGDCNDKSLIQSYTKLRDSLFINYTNADRPGSIYYMQIRDTANCYCHVKFDGDDSLVVFSIFRKVGLLKEELVLVDTLALSDTLAVDSASLDSLNEVEPMQREEPVEMESEPEVEADTADWFTESDSVEVDSTQVLEDSL